MYERIAANRWRTAFLLVASVALLAGLGYVFGLLLQAGPVGAVVALVLAGVMSISSYRYGDRVVLRAARARRVSKEEQPRYHNIVEGLCIAAGLPKPELYVIPERAPNAFATGRNPESSSIAVTEGLLERMNRLELEGVLAHELAHVKNRDILVGTIAATLTGAVVLLADFMMRWFWWGGRRAGERDGRVFAIVAAVGLVLAVLGPLFAQVIRLAISRRREYLADAEAALLTRYPPGLASALRKIAEDTSPMRVTNNATAHLWLSQPSRTSGASVPFWERLFSTHPPVADRIRILEEM